MNLPFIFPCFFVVVSTAAEARQNALGRRKRERERLYARVRGSIVYCLLCNSQRMALISRADCDTEPWWGTEGIMLFHNYLSLSFSFTLGHTVEWLMAAMWKKLPGWGVKFKLLLSGALFGFYYDVLLRLPETSPSLREANEATPPHLPFINSCLQWARTW